MSQREVAPVEALEGEIWRIDTGYLKPGLAACYLVRGGEDYALVDCGTGLSVPVVLSALDALEIAPEAVRLILPTHVHLDHAGGAGGLMRALPQARLYAHPRGLRHLVDPSRLLAGARAVYGDAAFERDNGEILPVPPGRSAEVADGTCLDLGGRQLVLRDAPGHARHHLVVWDQRSRGVFTGDVFGLCYPQLEAGGRAFILPTTTPVQFDPQAWQDTLRMLAGHKPRRMYLTHFGCVDYEPRLARELAQRIEEHARLVVEHGESGELALAGRLADAAWRDYQAQGGDWPRARFDSELAMDLGLNAQGLMVWRQQQAHR